MTILPSNCSNTKLSENITRDNIITIKAYLSYKKRRILTKKSTYSPQHAANLKSHTARHRMQDARGRINNTQNKTTRRII